MTGSEATFGISMSEGIKLAVEEFNVRNVEYFRNILLTFSLIGKYFTITERVFLKTEVDGKRYESFLILKTYSNKTKLHPIYSDIIKLYYPDWYFIPKSLWSIRVLR